MSERYFQFRIDACIPREGDLPKANYSPCTRAVDEAPDQHVNAEIPARPRAQRPPAGEDRGTCGEVIACRPFGQRDLDHAADDRGPQQRIAVARPGDQRCDQIARTDPGRCDDDAGAELPPAVLDRWRRVGRFVHPARPL